MPESITATTRGAIFRALAELAPGDAVPPGVYILDYADGTRPRWTVHAVERINGGASRRLVLVDRDNQTGDQFEILPVGPVVAVTVLALDGGRQLRSQPHTLGDSCGNTLCDLTQQARHVAKETTK